MPSIPSPPPTPPPAPAPDPGAAVRMTAGSEAAWSDHRSGMRIQFGVSGEQSGSTQVFMTRQRIPPGMRSTPHFHVDCETAIYILRGPVELRYGLRLEQSHHAATGNFLFIPPNAVHQIVNGSATDEAEVVLCRNAAEEIVQEVAIP